MMNTNRDFYRMKKREKKETAVIFFLVPLHFLRNSGREGRQIACTHAQMHKGGKLPSEIQAVDYL